MCIRDRDRSLHDDSLKSPLLCTNGGIEEMCIRDSTKSVEVILDACCGAIAEGLEERKPGGETRYVALSA